MCGIVGILNQDESPVDPNLLARMTRMVAHRGPDGEGQHVDGPVGFGHRRLAILDLTDAARQPMADDGGDHVITYNGEVYNFRELRAELEAKGHRFRSKSDTEVVLKSYVEWGESCLDRLNGMFAFAIWNRARRELFLARDRYGVKPLYTVRLGRTLLFASEIKAFFPHPAFRVQVSAPHLLEYFTFQNVFTDGTLFRGVRLVPPGHAVTAPLDGPERSRSYWDFGFHEAPDTQSEGEIEDELERLIVQAVKRQLVSDADVGSYLSGGLDSGSITAIASGEQERFHSFTAGFDLSQISGLELACDEREKAEALSSIFQTEHYEVVLKARDMTRCMRELVWHLEDLRVGQCYPNFYVSRLAAKFVKSILSGTGGDELYAGYPWRYYRVSGSRSFDEYVDNYYAYWHRLIPNRIIKDLFVPEVWNEVRDLKTIDIFRSVLQGHGGTPKTPAEYVQQSLYFEAKTFLPGLLLVEDKLSMAHGLETRVPFLDNDMVDFAQRVPVRLKLLERAPALRLNENDPGPKADRYFQETRDGKLLLRKVLARHVPETTANQVKRGFTGPDGSWFNGQSLNYVKEILEDRRNPIYAFLRQDTTLKLVEEHLSGTANRRLFIWSVLCMHWWCRDFLEGRHEAE